MNARTMREMQQRIDKPRWFKVRWKFGLFLLTGVGVTVALLTVIAVLGLHYATRHEPEFYQRALQVAPQEQQVAGAELERGVLQLHNEVRRSGRWKAIFTQDQINGWLASDLKEKFPKLLPRGVMEPRVWLQPDNAHLACRYESPKVSTVVSLSLAVHLTDEPNVVAVRIRRVRAGALPLPLKNFLDRITRVAATSGLRLRWAQEDGDPVALLTVPSEHKDYVTQGVCIESVELRDGEIYLAGSSGSTPPDQVASISPLNVKRQR